MTIEKLTRALITALALAPFVLLVLASLLTTDAEVSAWRTK